ncbi:hypothetical protein FQA39_LY12407 [Lamprigera yunnana]|nr:hypothetical protein FQA39_LY12407 [Lamprigera yunnana]
MPNALSNGRRSAAAFCTFAEVKSFSEVKCFVAWETVDVDAGTSRRMWLCKDTVHNPLNGTSGLTHNNVSSSRSTQNGDTDTSRLTAKSDHNVKGLKERVYDTVRVRL